MKPTHVRDPQSSGDGPAELERLLRKARAEWAISRIRSRARKYGLDRLAMDEIDAGIQAASAERKRQDRLVADDSPTEFVDLRHMRDP